MWGSARCIRYRDWTRCVCLLWLSQSDPGRISAAVFFFTPSTLRLALASSTLTPPFPSLAWPRGKLDQHFYEGRLPEELVARTKKTQHKWG